MKFSSQIVSAASGSIGGCTFSRNRSGQYIRRRALPINPASTFQQLIRAAMSSLVTAWTGNLTQAQRDAWEIWAINTPYTDALGNPVIITGQNAYVSLNTPRIQASLTVINTAPSIFSGTSLTPPSFTIADESAQTVTFSFNNADEWASLIGGALLVYVGRPQNASINFFKGPYRYAGSVLGAIVPPTSPATLPTPFPFVQPQRVFMQWRAVGADGRISAVQRDSVLVTL